MCSDCLEHEMEQIATIQGAVAEETGGETPKTGYEVAIFGFADYDALPITVRYESEGFTFAWQLIRVDIRARRMGGKDYTCVYRLLRYRSLS